MMPKPPKSRMEEYGKKSTVGGERDAS